jgi:hypothetical protein
MEFILKNWDKITTIIFAALSAIFAGITVWLTYLSYKRDNPKVIVKANRGFLTYTSGSLRECIICSITNHGRRSIKVKNIYFSTESGANMFFPSTCEILISDRQLPLQLAEATTAQFFIDINGLKIALSENKAKIKALCFSDELDKVYSYRLKKRHWKDLYN